MSHINLPRLEHDKTSAEHTADVLEALLRMIEMIASGKGDKIDRSDIDAVRERIDEVRTRKIFSSREIRLIGK